MDMTEKELKGTLIYQPRGAAGEYAKWAINLYNGCLNQCTYCYNRRGVQSHAFGNEPVLAAPIAKKAEAMARRNAICDKIRTGASEDWHPDIDYFVRQALFDIIDKDVWTIGQQTLAADGGVFMSFKCDPLSEQTQNLHFFAALVLMRNGVPVTLLTKNTEWMYYSPWAEELENLAHGLIYNRKLLTVGFTITGCDKEEPYAPSTKDRIKALIDLHDIYNIKTFVSLEPIIDLNRARLVIESTKVYANEIRIGCMSPLKRDRYLPINFILFVEYIYQQWKQGVRFYIKDSMVRQACFMPGRIKSRCLDLLIEITGERFVNDKL